jgi:serine phosphatase RsbU (regulator of sigma subunit)
VKILLLSFFFLFFTIYGLLAQQGPPLCTHFSGSKESENQNCTFICQDENSVMLFANRKGILAFDGQDWLTLDIPVIPYAMQRNPYDGKIYIGGDNNFGFLEMDNSGKYKYVPLLEKYTGIGIVTRIIFSDSLVWFYSDKSAIRYNLADDSHKLLIKAALGQSFSGMFVTSGNTYFNIFEKGLCRLERDTLIPLNEGYRTEKTSVLFSLPYNASMVLLGLSTSKLFLFDGKKYYNYPIKDEGYLSDNILSDGIALGDTAYAFSTLDGGALVVEKKSGKILFTINNQFGLPDDEVFAIGSDNSGGLWLSHQYGLTRADLLLPVSNFSVFPGLRGNLTSILKYENELYVATSEGVFYLSEIKNYQEIETFLKSESQTFLPLQEVSPSASERLKQKGIKGFVKKIFRKKTAPQMVHQRDNSKIKSIKYIYRKVDGLNEKCRWLVSTPHGILVASNQGLFIINRHKAFPLVSNRYINFISQNPKNGKYFIGANDGYFSIFYKNGKWKAEFPDHRFFSPVYSIVAKGDTLWLGGENSVYCAAISNRRGTIKYETFSVENDYPQRYKIEIINDSVFLFTESGVYYYNTGLKQFDVYNSGPEYFFGSGLWFFFSRYPLIKLNGRWISEGQNLKIGTVELSLLKLFDNIVSITQDAYNLWIISGDNTLYAIDRKRTSGVTPSMSVLIKNISDTKGIKFNLNNVKFKRGANQIFFDIIAPFYLKQNTILYQYNISKVMDGWSPWSVNTHYERVVAKPGNYVLKVRAKDIWNNITEEQSIAFTIKAPFTQTLFFYIIVGLGLFIGGVLLMRFRERQLNEKNRILEEKVNERTSEIKAQKEEITSSIKYASRIQSAMLPQEIHFKEAFSDFFIFFKPKDIISGDFYWIGTDDHSVFFCVADCTGHGVPGAFMSALGISTLNEIIANNHIHEPGSILNLLRAKIKVYLRQTGKDGEAKDGMDIAFCMLSKNLELLQFAGAFNSLIIFQNGSINEYKADRMPIGIYYGEERPFTNYKIQVKKNDTLYIFSDGFEDQFGGIKGGKYKISNFKKLLANIHNKPMAEQRNIIENEFINWKGPLEQTDDVTILGIKI